MSATVKCVLVLLLSLSAIGAPSLARAEDPVMEWNDIARQLIVVQAFSPVQQTRAMAIVHIAMHDAVNGVTGEYELSRQTNPPPAGAGANAAAIGAGYVALVGLLGESEFLTNTYNASIVAHGVSPSDPGLGFGQAVGEAIVASRQNDGSIPSGSYELPAPGIGVWNPMGARPLLPEWGNVTPFVLRSGSQFRPDPPPALDSEQYAKDYIEVLQVGAANSASRTGDQTNIANFWLASPTALWNPLLRQAINSRSFSLSQTAQVMALFYLAASDASVACWEAKYYYHYWRPQAAIVNGDLDGNALTPGDPTWVPLVRTPPHPEYPSGHATNSGAMASVLKEIFGDAPGYVIEAKSSTNVGFVRYWQTFSEGVEEVIDARVYSGIHFRTADEVGARLGRQVAHFVLRHALKRTK